MFFHVCSKKNDKTCKAKDFIKMFCKFKLEMQMTLKTVVIILIFGKMFVVDIFRISQVSGCSERIS